MDLESKEFYTKLSLTKFIKVIDRLTANQRELVNTIGLGHLLGIKCEVLPRGMMSYLVSKFDARSRTFNLPNGPSVVFTALVIHKVLGTPIGGRHIGQKVDEDLRVYIATVTKCKGRYPTLTELDSLMTADLEGDLFKIVFGMYTMIAFLCPSSYDAVSPDYLHIFREPDEIGSFDFSAAVFEKLISSIELYNDGLTTVLGGNLLSLLIFYLEFLDCNIVPFHLKRKLPRVSIWTTEMVKDIEVMDCISWDDLSYGKLKIKDVFDTPFACNSTISDVMANNSYDDLLQFVLSVCPEEHHKVVNEQLPIIISNIQKDIVESVQSVLFENIINILKLLPSMQPSYHNKGSHKSQLVSPLLEIPVSGLNGDNVKTQMFVGQSSVSDNQECRMKLEACSDVTNSDSRTQQVRKDELPDVTNSVTVAQEVLQHKLPDIFLLPVPSDKDLDEEACCNGRFSSLRSLMDVIQTIPLENGFELPPYDDSILQCMYPQKIEMSNDEGAVPKVFDLLTYILEEIASEDRLRSLMTEKICSVEEKVEVFNDLFTSSSTMLASKEKKRAPWLSSNDDALNCIALKKRARMLQMDHENLSDVHYPAETLVRDIFHDAVQPSSHARTRNLSENTSNFGTTEDTFDEVEWERQLVESTIKAEQEYEARKLKLKAASQATQNFVQTEVRHHGASQATQNFVQTEVRHHAASQATQNFVQTEVRHHGASQATQNFVQTEVIHHAASHATQNFVQTEVRHHAASEATQNFVQTEVRHQEMVTSFSSTLVESEVFSDIVARVPQTAKSKTTQIVVMGSTWAEHRVFGLSMQVYGRVHKFVVNMLGKAVMVEDIEKKKFGILQEGHWKRYFFECQIAALFQLDYENPGTLSKYLSSGMLGFRLDTMDLVHLPMFTSGFYYLLVINFKRKVFEVFMTNRKFHLVEPEASVAIKNFKMAFRLAYKNSMINIDQMGTVFESVCNTNRDGDSGIFLMKLICDYNRDKTFLFKPEHAKPIREILTYYMVAHPFNEKMPPETKRILQKHNIPYDYSTPRYMPWMHEQSAELPGDPEEANVLF